MIKNKFCIVGIDRDFEEFIIENKGNYLGLISDYKKNYKITKRAGKEKITDWLKTVSYTHLTLPTSPKV